MRAWAVKRKLAEERWSTKAIKEMVGTPNQPDPGKPGMSIPIRISVPTCEDIPSDEVILPKEVEAPRRVYTKQRHLQQYGYTADCEAWKRMRAGGMALGRARPHTEEGRRRLEAEMEKDEGGRRWKQ